MHIRDSEPGTDALAFSVEEAARRASVGRTIIYAAIKLGLLKARKVGRRTVILEVDLREWLDSLPTLKTAA
ncbi:hypothetical protein A1351_22835 [Methylosinus sp. R-45379]|uniref:helix-turn-helix domain-containing protein n=1 Tax=Methylosinus sp. R-45379 TaxID=980563 RepID=UPI0007C95E51|nr:helix-turn-helix domain-containing protein [Methylosinus sp. R-45379]OAI30446.1 hypothetical protein A1351_22835 [Methylosinus sp. R-45379]